MSKKLAVLFLGIGYHNDKPFMYYTKKIASNHDYEIIQLSYDLILWKLEMVKLTLQTCQRL